MAKSLGSEHGLENLEKPRNTSASHMRHHLHFKIINPAYTHTYIHW
jgi:hypothetical protein